MKRFITIFACLGALSCSNYRNNNHFAEGAFAETRGLYKQALREYQQIDPDHFVYQSAAERIEVIEVAEKELSAAEQCAEKSYTAKKVKKALACYKIVLKHRPWDATARNRVEELEELQDAPAKSQGKSGSRPATRDAKQYQNLMDAAEEHAGKGNYVEAYNAFSRAMGRAVTAEQKSEATTKRDAIAQKAQAAAQARYQSGMDLMTAGNYQDAIKQFQSLETFEPLAQQVYDRLGTAYKRLGNSSRNEGNYKDAKIQFENAFKYSPSDELSKLIENMINLDAATSDKDMTDAQGGN